MEESIGWVLDGKGFVIRSKERLCKTWLPLFFGQAKFSSFTRKLYRWGFRKVNLAPQAMIPTACYFGNEYFQRDNKGLLSRMRSVTAAKTRSERAAESARHSITMPQGGPSVQPAQPSFQVNPQQLSASLPNMLLQQTQVAPPLGIPSIQQAPILDQSALMQQKVNLAQLLRELAAQQQLGGMQPQAAETATNQLLLGLSLSMSHVSGFNQMIQTQLPFAANGGTFNSQPQQPQVQQPAQSQVSQPQPQRQQLQPPQPQPQQQHQSQQQQQSQPGQWNFRHLPVR
jgi:hypothetical protein